MRGTDVFKFTLPQKCKYLSRRDRNGETLPQMAVQTSQLDKSSVKSMLAVLKASVNSTERQMPKLLSKKELATIFGLSTKIHREIGQSRKA